MSPSFARVRLPCVALLWAVVHAGLATGCSARAVGVEGDAGRELRDGAAPDARTRPDAASEPDAGSLLECPTDPVAPNHEKSAAHPLGADGAITGLVVCRGRDDWFRLDVPPGHEMQFDVCTLPGAVAPRFEFFRDEYENPDAHLGGGTYGSDAHCQDTMIWQGAGRYFFRVFTEEEQVPYWVDLHLAPRAPARCSPDAMEPNDSAAAAHSLSFGATHDLLSCIDDEDWFLIQLQAGDRLTVRFEVHGNNGYETNLAIFDDPQSGQPLLLIPDYPTPGDVPFETPVTGSYLLRVQSAKYTRSYSLRVDR